MLKVSAAAVVNCVLVHSGGVEGCNELLPGSNNRLSGGSGLDYVISLSEGGDWVLITVDYGGGGGKG